MCVGHKSSAGGLIVLSMIHVENFHAATKKGLAGLSSPFAGSNDVVAFVRPSFPGPWGWCPPCLSIFVQKIPQGVACLFQLVNEKQRKPRLGSLTILQALAVAWVSVWMVYIWICMGLAQSVEEPSACLKQVYSLCVQIVFHSLLIHLLCTSWGLNGLRMPPSSVYSPETPWHRTASWKIRAVCVYFGLYLLSAGFDFKTAGGKGDSF